MVIISTIYSKLNQYNYKKSIITIGSFDGLHLGHKKIFNKMKNLSIDNLGNKSNNKVLITFNPHPINVLNPKKEKEQYILTPVSDKLKLLEKYFDDFIDLVIVISFTKTFSKISAKIFFNQIIKSFDPIHIVIGDDHGFGYKRKGNVQFLKDNYEKKHNLKIHQISPKKSIIGSNSTQNSIIERISSTLIRNKILNTEIKEANSMLNRYYSVKGKVVKGRGIGKQINFPTINIQPNHTYQILPSRGVYFVKLKINQIKYSGMCNIGIRPTLTNSKEETIEIHIFRADIDMNFYNNEVNIYFVEYIRSEKRFKNIKFLIKQLEKDKKICESLMAKGV